MSFSWAKPYEPQAPAHALAGRAAAASAPRLWRGRRRLSGAAQPQLLVEFRRSRRAVPDDPDRHRHRAGDALLRERRRRVQFGRAHHARRQCRLAAPLRPHERRQLLLHRHLHPHLPRALLRLVQGAARAGVDARPRHLPADDGDRVHGLRAALGPDELLGRAGHHRLLLGLPAGRRADPHLAARRLCARTRRR